MATVLVCSIGGHLAQLHALLPRFADVDPSDVLWVTHESGQSQSLLADQNVLFVPYIEERDVKGVARAFAPAIRTLKNEQADLVISTGSAIAGAWLPAAVLLRKRAVFIESAAMVDEHTRTGRLLQLVPGVRLLTQSAATASGRWTHCGSVFDGFHARRTEPAREPRFVVVSVGTSREFGFERLIQRLIEVIPEGVKVLWQTGHTDVANAPIEATPWLPGSELTAAMREADVVISHAGGGSALGALLAGKRPILVPRRAAHGEFRDDHQVQIAHLLDDRNVAVQTSIEDLDWESLIDAVGWTVSEAPDPVPITF